MNYLEKPRKLQFELSSMCNALCLGCVRTDSNHYNGKKSLIPDKEYISYETFKKIITAPEFSSVRFLEFCGTIDDPLMHPEFDKLLELAAEVGQYHIIIHTNASLRNEQYWSNLARILNKNHEHSLKFNIDGLEDTNHIYRQNTSWSKIMANARAFIQAGGRAHWQYLIFPWNEHQLMQAKQLSVDMGFKEFSSRHDRSRVTMIGLDAIKNLKQLDIRERKHANSSVEIINQTLKQEADYGINCNNKEQGMYFIGYDARIWPCCFLHNGQLDYDTGKRQLLEKRLYDAYGSDDWNDLNKRTVKEILDHDFYKFDLTASWDSHEHSEAVGSRIHRCTETCSTKKLQQLPIGKAKII